MLRSPPEFRQLHAADGEEHAARPVTERADRSCDIGHIRPAIIVLLPPRQPGKSCDGNPHLPARGDRISRNLDSERVRGVEDRANSPLDQVGLEPIHAAEAANTEGYRWRQWISRPTGEGQHRLKVPAVDDPLGQRGCLGRAAKYQKPHLSALRRFTR